jgi:hypothetical protein
MKSNDPGFAPQPGPGNLFVKKRPKKFRPWWGLNRWSPVPEVAVRPLAQAGWPEWATFRSLGNCLLWAGF